MRKVFLFMMVTADGYFEGPEHDISWHNVDEEFSEFAVHQLDEADTLVFGRRTYELMAGFWPTKQAMQADTETAKRMINYHKAVFSHTLQSADWQNTELFHDDPGNVIQRLKEQPGKSIAVLGSSNLCVSLLNAEILDEIRLMINPIVLGSGTPLFAGLKKRQHLNHESTRTFTSGNVLLTYDVTRGD
jgi:dihydrofolate reductase